MQIEFTVRAEIKTLSGVNVHLLTKELLVEAIAIVLESSRYVGMDYARKIVVPFWLADAQIIDPGIPFEVGL